MSVVVVLSQRASAQTLNTDLGTANAANWSVTVGGGGSGTPFSVNPVGRPNGISITSNTTVSGQWVPGASEATFNGFWSAKETFSIPADAINVSLGFSGLRADDRCVLELNGTILGDYFLNAHVGPGVMSFTTAAADVPYTFTFVTDGQIASGFHSGENELLLIVNNTGWYNQDSGTRIMWGGDGTDVALNATLSYTIPEPSTFALVGIAAASLIGLGWRRRSA